MSCIICETSGRRAFVCPQCFAASSAGRQADRRSLQEQRDDAARQLDAALADKATYQRQQLQLHHLAEQRLMLRQRAAEAERQLTEVTQRTQAAQRRLQQRRQHLQEVQHDLAALSRQMQAAAAPQRNQQAAACLRSMEALAREQRVKVMRRVVEILPLSLVPAARPAVAAAAKRDAAAICSLPLPDGQMEMAEVARLSCTLGSALGYLALLLDVLSRFLQLPVPHRTAFQGSTSRLWQPEGFFDTRATPPYDALRLCWPPANDGGSALSTLTALAGSAGGGGGGAAAAAAAQRQEQQLRAALLALQRAAGMLVYARLGPEAGLKVPEDQAPLTWLAKLCRLLAAEPRGGASGGGGRAAAPGGRDLAASAVLGKGGRDGGTCTPSSRSVLLQDGRVGDEGAEDDWEHLPAHGMMPPRPWELEDVEHWEQANFADHHNGSGNWSSGGNGAPQSGGGNAVAALLVWTAATLKRGLGTAAGLGGPATSAGS
ncbi:hypothetical protein ACK3TF_003118 [Chlorella vulgaris]